MGYLKRYSQTLEKATLRQNHQDPKMTNHGKTSWKQRGTTHDVWPAIMAERRQCDDSAGSIPYGTSVVTAWHRTLSQKRSFKPLDSCHQKLQKFFTNF